MNRTKTHLMSSSRIFSLVAFLCLTLLAAGAWSSVGQSRKKITREDSPPRHSPE